MRTSEALRTAAGDLWDKYVKHEFVLRVADGTLPREVFRYYLIQDAKYVEEMRRAVIKASSGAPLNEAVDVLNAVFANPEHGAEVHSRLYKALGISGSEVASTGFNLVNYAYTRHLHYYADKGWPEFLAAWAPCMWGYMEVGSLASSSKDPIYREWASFYASEDYAGRVSAVLKALDSHEATAEMRRAFINSVRFEIMFWEQAMRLEQPIY